ncbi:MAG: demethoxyubiquinone hydroxylase family protein [Rickettsiales bacterium]|nr:demethoxyubiquinone hydroxylase family protein [Rickettsiales bacterium]
MPKPYFYNHEVKINEIIRVDHAGEYGAKRIYQGQIDGASDKETKKVLHHMLEQELEHLSYFETQIENSQSRPTIFMPMWNVMGYMLGRLSIKLGKKSAMQVTQAIEEVIVEHYQQQIDYLESSKTGLELLDKIKQFKNDEAEHINVALNNGSNEVFLHRFYSDSIKQMCKIAIFLSKKA